MLDKTNTGITENSRGFEARHRRTSSLLTLNIYLGIIQHMGNMTLTVKTTGIDQALFAARVLGKEAPMVRAAAT